VPDERVEALCARSLALRVLRAWPLKSVFDRPDGGHRVRKDGTVTSDTTFKCPHRRARRRRRAVLALPPQQKGAVENLVGWVKAASSSRALRDDEDLPATGGVAPRGELRATITGDQRSAR